MTVHFIGAGPGAPDLITVRGLRLIERCPVCLYAGSLVPIEIVAAAPPGARVLDTAPVTLDRSGATLVVHLSVRNLLEVERQLTPSYGADCPVIVAYRVGWADEAF